MATLSNKNQPKISQKFYCEICDYSSSKVSNYKQHLESKKHKCNKNVTKISHENFSKKSNDIQCDIVSQNEQISVTQQNGNQNQPKISQPHICLNCNMIFKTRSGLWRHNKNCIKNENTENSIISTTTDKDLVMMLIKENSELKNMMMKVIENGTYNNNNNTNNSHNKTFNLQFFLNETCKDAMNIMDFVNSMEIDLDDLEKVGELGYVNGMTNIILKNLKALDVTKRPLHCTDAKREIMYIKDDNKWEKENENKDKMKKALKYIIHKNAKMLNVFKAKYPDCIKSYSNRCDQYNKLVVEVLGGKGDNEAENNEKIIRRIAKEMTIDKSL